MFSCGDCEGGGICGVPAGAGADAEGARAGGGFDGLGARGGRGGLAGGVWRREERHLLIRVDDLSGCDMGWCFGEEDWSWKNRFEGSKKMERTGETFIFLGIFGEAECGGLRIDAENLSTGSMKRSLDAVAVDF